MRLPRQLSYEFALVAILCTVALFLFPAVQGPYSAVHGPVTALLSLKAKVFLCLRLASRPRSVRREAVVSLDTSRAPAMLGLVGTWLCR